MYILSLHREYPHLSPLGSKQQINGYLNKHFNHFGSILPWIKFTLELQVKVQPTGSSWNVQITMSNHTCNRT